MKIYEKDKSSKEVEGSEASFTKGQSENETILAIGSFFGLTRPVNHKGEELLTWYVNRGWWVHHIVGYHNFTALDFFVKNFGCLLEALRAT